MAKLKLEGNLDGDKVIITNKRMIDKLLQGDFGEKINEILVLDFYETLYLMEKRNLKVIWKGQNVNKMFVIEKILKESKQEFLMHKYQVYKIFRDKGYVIKTGLKFGFDFRVYPKGQKMGEAHTKYVVAVWPQEKKISTESLSRSVRMAKGLNANFILAVVDNELDVVLYEIKRKTDL